MTDFLYTLFNPLPNAVMTVLVAIVFVYWIFVLVLGIGLDDLDLGIDFGSEVDIDIDVDIDAPSIDIDATDVDGDIVIGKESPNLFFKCLSFLNLGQVPFMLVLSIFLFILWILSLTTTHFVDVSGYGSLSVLILAPLFVVTVFLTRLATTPLVKVFKALNYHGESTINFFGCSGKMLSKINEDKVGRAEVIIDQNPIIVNVISDTGEILNYGDNVLILREDTDKNIYRVVKN